MAKKKAGGTAAKGGSYVLRPHDIKKEEPAEEIPVVKSNQQGTWASVRQRHINAQNSVNQEQIAEIIKGTMAGMLANQDVEDEPEEGLIVESKATKKNKKTE